MLLFHGRKNPSRPLDITKPLQMDQQSRTHDANTRSGQSSVFCHGQRAFAASTAASTSERCLYTPMQSQMYLLCCVMIRARLYLSLGLFLAYTPIVRAHPQLQQAPARRGSQRNALRWPPTAGLELRQGTPSMLGPTWAPGAYLAPQRSDYGECTCAGRVTGSQAPELEAGQHHSACGLDGEEVACVEVGFGCLRAVYPDACAYFDDGAVQVV